MALTMSVHDANTRRQLSLDSRACRGRLLGMYYVDDTCRAAVLLRGGERVDWTPVAVVAPGECDHPKTRKGEAPTTHRDLLCAACMPTWEREWLLRIRNGTGQLIHRTVDHLPADVDLW